ncbi:hypothetical protein A3C09_02870 [Candidatus Uhrbacteria bacterium RIFCSPHIGHO2_02_FULL_47_44]|uniref:Uncharacterized protein n=1 Tax=Candidatus Uhrbacteria bacterium RIFCSPLOWO2_02_FULL_48_18 TaxID=1802408 RepID=A0A1F7VCA2_9BACT|nr:MAG: hypothetical protein A2839_02240 [Candidatus Uhrbacteria bacterium RIFCSPHIGHO2_01_FULL_47_10]OGL71678.1 MAG: hypothetical protein A3C09_02870 [Candidatus Uhrbacteria bacterium RIFCSPHIGHO2_02_FULL_47_44]OGL77326.1 MAG: hypothetical protein A3E97_04330 [Candidatus Uhrbacteria bacterium RIFCSPHIGHO2_12_FULL_47_12]OGL80671.1 MAG: hypothetical protein A3B20_04745 [Candidatus Uhrbacteria bacterium RIFCSPLOWO2_01_FULL_47_17]OGL88146.1 MAG: hypothetical protein A3I41_00235 [Candidatus Uhrbact
MPSQGQAEKCLGCEKYAYEENIVPIFALGGTRPIGHVHKTPSTARADLIPACHRRAYDKLKGRFPTIKIETRTLDTNTKFVSSGRPSGSYRAVSGSSAVKYTERRMNEPAAGYTAPNSSMTPRPSTF